MEEKAEAKAEEIEEAQSKLEAKAKAEAKAEAKAGEKADGGTAEGEVQEARKGDQEHKSRLCLGGWKAEAGLVGKPSSRPRGPKP